MACFGRKPSRENVLKMIAASKLVPRWNEGRKGLDHHTEEVKRKLSYSKTDERNPSWKGDSVSLYGLHRWVERKIGRPDKCSLCKTVGKVDLANISQEYKRDLSDWEWLCRKCHMTKDGRLKMFRLNHYSGRGAAYDRK